MRIYESIEGAHTFSLKPHYYTRVTPTSYHGKHVLRNDPVAVGHKRLERFVKVDVGISEGTERIR